ncbi:MAG: pilus assembly protein PilM [Candidatus Niameybacter stercoravium]|nr:pilus assembly protein PilM [Candidatus Niameybacter stercoravium]
MLLAIDIGSRYIHIVEGFYKNEQFKISRTIMTLTPEGSVADGELIHKEEIISKLKKVIKEEKFNSKKVIFTINPGSVVTRKLIVPNVKPKEILSILQNEMEALMNFSEPYIVDYTNVEEKEDNTLEIEAVAIAKSIIEEYLDIAKKLKLKPVGLDIHQNAITKFTHHCSYIEDKNIIIADIGNSYMNTYLFNNGTYMFSRRMLINTEQYERTLVSLGKLDKMNGTFSQLDLSVEALAKDAVLENTITLYLGNIVEQLQRMVQFNSSMGNRAPIKHIYLCGAMANMKGIYQYIHNYIDLPIANIQEIIKGRVCNVEASAEYINTLGALMVQDKNINFFERYREKQRREKQLSKTTLSRIAVIGGIIVVTGLAYSALAVMQQNIHSQIAEIDAYIQSPEVQEQLEELNEKVKIYDNANSYYQAVKAAGSKIETYIQPDAELVSQLVQLLPQGVTIENFSYSNGNISMSLKSDAENKIANYVHALKAQENIMRVDYFGYSKDDTGYNTSVSITLKPAGGE